MYNLTNLSNANDYLGIIRGLNETGSGSYIGIVLLAALFIILFITFKKSEDDTTTAFLTSSTITTIIAALMWGINLISWHIMIYPVVFVFASLSIYMFKR